MTIVTMSPRKLPFLDPKTVPVLYRDIEAPPVPAERLTAQGLRRQFLQPPVWAPESRPEPRVVQHQPRCAAVLVPVVMRAVLTVLLTQRTHQLASHAGEIAFPGGKVDDADAGVVQAALREAEEEIGLEQTRVDVLGCLPEYLTGTAYRVTPVVGLIDPGFVAVPNPSEVAEVFEVPLSFLMDPANHQRHATTLQGQHYEWYSMPYAQGGQERYIWGATAGMLRNFYHFLRA